MITVLACENCQKFWDQEAEYFRNTLVAQIDRVATPVSDRLLEGSVLRSLTRSGRARTDFFSKFRQVEVRNPAGIILEE